jgi:hypothetical protein
MRLMLLTRSHARRYDMGMERAAALMEPWALMASSSCTFPGPSHDSSLK